MIGYTEPTPKFGVWTRKRPEFYSDEGGQKQFNSNELHDIDGMKFSGKLMM